MTAIPRVSIILPTFDRSDMLPIAVRSVLNQSLTDWELVLVDDASQDRTPEVIVRLLTLDPRIRSIRLKTNMGAARARNVGILASRGRYVTFLDSDDAYEPNHLEWRLRFMLSNPTVDFLHGGLQVIGSPWVIDARDPSRTVRIEDCAVCGTFFSKRDLLLRAGLFRSVPYAEDYDLFGRIAHRGKTVKLHSPATYRYIRSAHSLTQAYARKMGLTRAA